MFEKMTKILQAGTRGKAVLSTVEVTEHMSRVSAFRPGMFCPPGKYMNLVVNGELVMSDTSMEHATNTEVIRRAQGSVLVAGLGLGMILIPMARKPEVKSILVIEQSQDVVDLVWSQIQKALGKDALKVTVVCADIFQWPIPKGAKWDVVYFDIWPNICTDNLKEMATLHRRFARRYTDWMGSWCKDLLKSRKRREDREERRYRSIWRR